MRLGLVLAVAAAGLSASVVAVTQRDRPAVHDGRASATTAGGRVAVPARPLRNPPPLPSPSPAFFDPARAPAAELASAAENDKTLERTLGATGRDQGPWTQRAREVFLAMKGTIPHGLAQQILVKELGCYRAACMLEVGYATRHAFDGTREAFLANSEFRRWPAAKGHGAVEVTKAGGVKVTWLLMNPGLKRRSTPR